jgi:cytochrome c oxidase cbb3-type subunit 3
VLDRRKWYLLKVFGLALFGSVLGRWMMVREREGRRADTAFVSSPPVGDRQFRHRFHYMVFTAGAAIVVLAGILGSIQKPLSFRTGPAIAAELGKIRLMPNGISGAPPEVDFALGQPYENNAYNLAQGKRLYTWFGCSACHGDGQGGSGPSFVDGWWLYGPEMVSIVSSIRDGRPHGMPPFRDKMAIEQIWQLAGYVETMGAYVPKTAAPGRNDAQQTRPAENRAPAVILFNEGPAVVHPEQGPRP